MVQHISNKGTDSSLALRVTGAAVLLSHGEVVELLRSARLAADVGIGGRLIGGNR